MSVVAIDKRVKLVSVNIPALHLIGGGRSTAFFFCMSTLNKPSDKTVDHMGYP